MQEYLTGLCNVDKLLFTAVDAIFGYEHANAIPK
jgi:hypothetical protein